MIRGEDVVVNGDGETSRDFCFVENAVQANILAALAQPEGINQIYNVAYNARTSLKQLFEYLARALANNGAVYDKPAVHVDYRTGDIRQFTADIGKATRVVGYTTMTTSC